ncbi:ty3-gypsy retrotransposon protein [Tanacetum coccineum]
MKEVLQEKKNKWSSSLQMKSLDALLLLQRWFADEEVKPLKKQTKPKRSHTLEVVPYPDTIPNRVVSIDAFIEVDASVVGIGVVLLQKGQPLGYFKRKLGPRMRVAATYQKELCAIVEAVYKWRQYLVGRRFTIRTDHKEYKRAHAARASNLVADALSRVFEEGEEITTAFMALSRPVVGLMEDLKRENETLDELCQLHRRLDQGES